MLFHTPFSHTCPFLRSHRPLSGPFMKGDVIVARGGARFLSWHRIFERRESAGNLCHANKREGWHRAGRPIYRNEMKGFRRAGRRCGTSAAAAIHRAGLTIRAALPGLRVHLVRCVIRCVVNGNLERRPPPVLRLIHEGRAAVNDCAVAVAQNNRHGNGTDRRPRKI